MLYKYLFIPNSSFKVRQQASGIVNMRLEMTVINDRGVISLQFKTDFSIERITAERDFRAT